MKKSIFYFYIICSLFQAKIVFADVDMLKGFADKKALPENNQNIISDKNDLLKKDKNINFYQKSLFESDKNINSDKTALPERNKALPPELVIDFKSSFALSKNNLLKSPHNWSIGIPYAELDLSYHFSTNSFFEVEFDLSYKDMGWNYSIDDFFIKQNFLFYIPISIKAGYFSYPVSYTSDNTKIFSKKTLMQKNLFPLGRRDMGALFEGNFWKSFYVNMGLQASLNQRETDAVQRLGQQPVLTGSLIYKKLDQKAFLSYFQKDFFLEGSMQSLGFGADLSYKISSWSLSLRSEFWDIKQDKPDQTLFTYYFFPSLRWDFVSVAVFFGGVHHYLQQDKNHTLEYILKAKFYLTESFFLTIEKFKEKDTVIKKEAWAFSLKTNFDI